MIELIKYNKSGFTLIEITLALLILAVGLVGILTLFPVGFDASVRAANITKATFLAQEKMEDLKREGYGGTDLQNALGGSNPAAEFPSPYDNFEYEIGASNVITGSLCKVTVSVYWPADDGVPESRDNQRSVELNTYIAKYEP